MYWVYWGLLGIVAGFIALLGLVSLLIWLYSLPFKGKA